MSVSVFGLCLIIFTIGFHRSIANLVSKKRLFTIRALLVLSGAGAIISAIFTISNPALHGLGGIMVFGFPTMAQVAAGQKLRSFAGLRCYGQYTYVNGVATLALDFFLLSILSSSSSRRSSLWWQLFKISSPEPCRGLRLSSHGAGLQYRD